MSEKTTSLQNEVKPLTPEDYRIAEKKLSQLTKDTKKESSLYAATTIIELLANISVTFCQKDEERFDMGWFYTYIASHLVSGASARALDNLIYEKYQKKSIAINNQLQEEYDSFSITERQNRSSDKVLYDMQQIQTACNMYWSQRARLIAGAISTPFLLSTAMYAQLSNLPVIASAFVASSAVSYFLQEKLYKQKVKYKEVIRKRGNELNKKNREIIATSVEREISDPKHHEQSKQKQKQESFLKGFQEFTAELNKFVLRGTIAKAAIVAGVIAATYTNPSNMLITSTATLLIHNTVDSFWSARFSVKEWKEQFAYTYRSFKSKIKDIVFGKEKIPQAANVIELDHISFKHRDKKDLTARTQENLFESDETMRIAPGITFLIGASGAGKSTLLDLLKHSDNLSSGHIRIGTIDKENEFHGKDYTEIAFAEQAHHIAYDTQKSKLNDGTVNDFIIRANPNASPELVAKIKEIVGITDNPSDSGLTTSTQITDKLSGGEISRLKLAQALIKDSPILILDEATTGMDQNIRDNVINYINSIKDKKTIVWVTHWPEEIEKLEAYQTIGISKPDENSPARIHTVSDRLQFLQNIKSASPSPEFQADFIPPEDLNLDEFITKAETSATEYELKAQKYQKLAEQSREAAKRIREKQTIGDNLRTKETTQPKQPQNSATPSPRTNSYDGKL